MEDEVAVQVVMEELAKWDDEFDSPKWAASTRRRMAESIVARLRERSRISWDKREQYS